MRRPLIGLDLTGAVKARPGGIAVYIRGLLRALEARSPDFEPVLFVRDGRWFRRRLVADLLPAARRRWLLTGLSFETRGLLRFHGLGVRLPRRCAAPCSFTLHDLRGIEAREFTDPRWCALRSARIRETVGRAGAVLFHTEHARRRFLHHFPAFGAERTAVALPGIDAAHFTPDPGAGGAALRERLGLDRPFLLQVGAPVPHKNPEGSLAAFARSNAAPAGALLAFAGAPDPRYQAGLEALAGRLGIAAQVRWLGRVAYRDLPALYRAAALVLMPSHYEGFGFPVAEAMACGAVGVVGARTSLEEVAGDAWPAADPREPEALAREIDRLLADIACRERARERSLARARDFSWDACAARTADFLLQPLQSVPTSR